MLSDRKIQRLSHRYGCKGICTYLTILCEIYGERGYYIPYSNDFCFDIAFTLGLEEAEVKEIVLYCVAVRLFDSELLECRQVLSSAGIQRRFREICKRSVAVIDPDLEIPPGIGRTLRRNIKFSGGPSGPAGGHGMETGNGF